jgi:hypothetical protein
MAFKNVVTNVLQRTFAIEMSVMSGLFKGSALFFISCNLFMLHILEEMINILPLTLTVKKVATCSR